MLKFIVSFLRMIRFSHSIFALPFALVAMLLAADGRPTAAQIFWIIVCCVAARTAAMAFNRIADLSFDRLNPRTRNRELVRGEISYSATSLAIILSSVIFVFSASRLNRLAFYLSPAALMIVLFYSFTKRFTTASHFVLGLALGLAPIGAWIAVRGELALTPLMLGLGVLLWTAGFDIIYACQDTQFDRRTGLHSIPARWGVAAALRASAAVHAASVVCFLMIFFLADLGGLYLIGLGLIAVLLAYEHSIVTPGDLSRVNVAFFTVNGIVSVLFFLCTLADIVIFR
ncbi:MAG: putative 4-hydroxybenzoate polyprenyltransferase [Candidatus Sumerlaeia bacterium]